MHFWKLFRKLTLGVEVYGHSVYSAHNLAGARTVAEEVESETEARRDERSPRGMIRHASVAQFVT